MPTLEQSPVDALFVMLKGEPGLRKSTQALSFPTPQYWISTDQKMEALQLPAKRWGVKMSDIHYHDYTDWAAPDAYLKQLQVNCPFKTIIIDSVTSLGDAMTRQVRINKAKDNTGKYIGGISVDGLEEFNAESGAFKELIAKCKDIHKFHKVNVIFIAHVIGARKDNDENKFTHHSRIIVTGAEKISAKLPSYMTEVYHFNIENDFVADREGKYSLFTVHTGNDFARTSLPLPGKITFNNDPLYETWIAPAIIRLKQEKPIERIPSQSTLTQSTQPPSLSTQNKPSFTAT
jgi:hypothetical protein